MTYISVDERQEHCRVILSCQNNQLYAQHGLKDFAGSSMHPLKNLDTQFFAGDFGPVDSCHVGKATLASASETRLYRSVENLHWATVADAGLYSPCRSLDNEFIFHYKGTSHWSDGSAAGDPAQSTADPGRHLPLHATRTPRPARNVPLLPFAKVPQWLLPPAEERALHGDAKRELKEKLRLHSAKAVEPCKPVRPQASLTDLVGRELSECQTSREYKNGCSVNCCAVFVEHAAFGPSPASGPGKPRPCLSRWITSPEDIKQEARRRLQLRRQNSSPNLTLLHAWESQEIAKSRTAESLRGCDRDVDTKGTLELSKKGHCRGRLYIPTFEEFKRMRSKEMCPSVGSHGPAKHMSEGLPSSQTLGRESKVDACLDSPQEALETKPAQETAVVADDYDSVFHEGHVPSGFAHYPDITTMWDGFSTMSTSGACQHLLKDETFEMSPICSSPIPRSPLQSVARRREGQVFGDKPQGLGTKQFSGVLHFAEQSLASEAPSSCCPSLLLEATDLSSYGAKLQKMKDEFIGSALDLIKKSCSTESAIESPSKGPCDQGKADLSSPEDSNQSTEIPMATQTWNKPNNETPGDALPAASSSSPSGRRSSSDMAHEAAECAKAQRECRLRPHFSDPMPADAVKRKQLELKIAAAARQHAHKRRQERDTGPVVAKANVGHGCSFDESSYMLSSSLRSKHRWSNVSSLSADSGIASRSDDKDNDPARTRSAEVERADSGIDQASARKWKSRASETLSSLQAWEAHRPCTDCGERDFPPETDAQNRNKRRDNLCEKCLKRRTERKESILEFVNTEASYGEDLRIIKEEFYLPMQAAGLLTPEQLLGVFSNIQELIDLNENFLEILQEEIDQAFDQGDDDLMTVCIGEVFLEFVNMLPAFQTYCLQQSSSVNMLNTLEKEKELLRIFLNVSQNDNTALRRMNLRSFLMAPLQRVTKYPLLLSRIIKATIEYHPDHSSLREAKCRIESHLEHINMKTKQEGNSWTLRSFRQDSKKRREVINIEMRETAIKTTTWLREETRFVMEGPLQLAQPPDGQWVKKGSKTLKFQNMQVLLMVNMKRASESSLESAELGLVKDAVLVLIRDKNNGKFSLLREPLRLSNCVVSADPDCDDTFELIEIRREAFVFRDSDRARTHHWFRQIRRYSRELGSWKKRRNALPNIMISTSHNRS
ncbi:PREDICTED: uncharacterized protein LOC109301426 [Gavialis gangeticus]|uniref:uncharacterized protein LOC109301426 n=1 Tax=Gavialis gangeticus TaxID=94835 RepID=UPI00092E2A66|nr:PREDICTED: uncharacterized protein LOC109301426 [Gavialis gangeticus]